MVNENIKLIENKKPFETVQEIENYQIKKSPLSPAARGKVVNKSGSNFLSGNKEGYGPTTTGIVHTYVNYPFILRIECCNWCGFGGVRQVNSVPEAVNCIRMLENGSWPNADWISNEAMQKCVDLINDAIRSDLNGHRVNGYVRVRGNFLGGYSWSRSY